jgi:hypothetical protein
MNQYRNEILPIGKFLIPFSSDEHLLSIGFPPAVVLNCTATPVASLVIQ